MDDVDYGIAAAAKVSKFLPSKLPKETQVLMDMIFSTEMFVHSMKEYDIGSEFVYGVNYNKPKCLIPLASQYLLLFFSIMCKPRLKCSLGSLARWSTLCSVYLVE